MSRLIDRLPMPTLVQEKKLIVTSKSRTGTFSMYQALQILGYKPYHMYEIVNDPLDLHKAIYEEALRCKYFGEGKPYGKAEFDKWFAEYDAIIEIAWFFADELVAAYPEAKFLHVERDVEKWHVSMLNTAGPLFKATKQFPLNMIRLMDQSISKFCSLHEVLEIIWYHGKGIEAGGDDAKADYLEFNQKVRDLIPEKQRLILNLDNGLGWEDMCPFLEKPVPDVPYPRGNAPAEFQKLADQLLVPRIKRGMAIIASVVLVPLASVGIWYYLRRKA
ncbi:hypothetical protein BX600DRAFT_528863 [Xylariales sp. PMI_506]|nr:hypothetical protein BX600DRAFT_528863 [Xylariales sp. PMI_506]